MFLKRKKAFPVQTVIRPKQRRYHDFRGYAGKLYGNNIKVECTVWSSAFNRIWLIFTFDKQWWRSTVGSSITELENDINVTRGDMIVKSWIAKMKRYQYNICWMDSKS
jgi:sulfate adenylyltransferase subunit 1